MRIGYDIFSSSRDSRTHITDLSPLRNLTRITGHLEITQNGRLVNLNDLNNLQYIGMNFRVSRNDVLTDLGEFFCFAIHWEIFFCECKIVN